MKEQPMMTRLRTRKQKADSATVKAVIVFGFVVLVINVVDSLAGVL